MIDHSRLRKARGPLTALVLLVAVGGTVLLAPDTTIGGPSTAVVQPGATTDETTRPSASVASSTSAPPGTTVDGGEDVEVAGLSPVWPAELQVSVAEEGESRYRADVAGGRRVLDTVLGALAVGGWGATSSDGKSWTLTGTSSTESYRGTAVVTGDVVAVTLTKG